MKPLYELATEYKHIQDKIDDLTDEDLEGTGMLELLDSMKLPIEQKVINAAAVIKNIDHYIEGLKKAEDAIKARRKTAEKKMDRIKEYILDNMQIADIRKINSPEMDVMIKNNPPKVEVFCESIMPKEYYRIKTIEEIDKAKLKEDLKNGVEVQGAKLVSCVRLEIK